MEDKNVLEFTFVNAGAGAGKTTNLVQHIVYTYAKYKLKHGKWPRIIGTTFTRKAANEIKERVAKQYHEYNLRPQTPEEETLNEFVKNNLEDLLQFSYSDYLNITTIHGICLQILLKKAYLLGFSTHIKVVSDNQLSFAQKKILGDVIGDLGLKELYRCFSFKELFKIIQHLDGLGVDQIKPADLQHLDSLYNDIFIEISEELKIILEYDEKTYNGFGNLTEKTVDYIKNIKVQVQATVDHKDFKILNEYISQIQRAPAPKGKACDPAALMRFKEFRNAFDKIKKHFLQESYEKFFNKEYFEFVVDMSNKCFSIAQVYSQKLKDYKKENSLITMNDVEALTLEVLQKYPSECKDFVDVWDYWYIDEYQDTSFTQSEIFKILLRNKSFYKVGDPQQSIYLFRGAQAQLFLNEWNEAQKSESIKDRVLEVNYRSHANLMAGMNEFFKYLESCSQDFKESFKPMKSPQEAIKGEDQRLGVYCFASDQKEQEYVLNQVEQLIGQGVLPQDICILARSKKILSGFEEAMSLRKLPCVAQFSGGFLDRLEVQGLLCFLKVMNNPDDDRSLIELLRTQYFKVDDEQLRQWTSDYRQAKSWSLWTEISKKDHSVIHAIKEHYFLFKEKDVIEGVKSYLSKSYAMQSGFDTIDLARRRANLSQVFAYVCKNFETSRFDIKNIIEDLESKSVEDLQSEAVFSESKNGVRLYTIHGSKGLEFKYVFLVGSGRKNSVTDFEIVEELNNTFVVPTNSPLDHQRKATVLRYFSHRQRTLAEQKEIRRVIYVAATRAEERLFITGAAKRNKNGALSTGDKSLFKIIDIENFLKSDLEFISAHNMCQSEDEAETLQQEKDYQYLEFNNQPEGVPEQRNKSVFNMKNISTDFKSTEDIFSVSVSKLVELKALQDFKGFSYSEGFQSRFMPVALQSFVTDTVDESLHFSMERFLKPYIGDLFHKSIELYSLKVDESILNEFMQQHFDRKSESVLGVIKEIASLAQPNMPAILNEARSEWGFNSLVTGNILLSGQIDLWGFDEKGELHIIDYKTGSRKQLNKAAYQLALYKSVLKKLYKNTPLHTHVIYPVDGVLINIVTSEIDPADVQNLFELIPD